MDTSLNAELNRLLELDEGGIGADTVYRGAKGYGRRLGVQGKVRASLDGAAVPARTTRVALCARG